MLGAAVEDIAQFLHQEERLDSVSRGLVQHVALWADVASHWLTPPGPECKLLCTLPPVALMSFVTGQNPLMRMRSALGDSIRVQSG